jgi:hypothetical protein
MLRVETGGRGGYRLAGKLVHHDHEQTTNARTNVCLLKGSIFSLPAVRFTVSFQESSTEHRQLPGMTTISSFKINPGFTEITIREQGPLILD